MAHIEAFHSSRGGCHFLGLRKAQGGSEVEIVYDDGVARRLVWRVMTPGANVRRVGDALRAAVDDLRVIPALQHELRKRSIAVEAVRG